MAAYKRPKTTLLISDIDVFFKTPTHTIIVVNLNSKHNLWFSSHTNLSGTTLAHYTDTRTYNAIIAPDSPIHFSHNPHHSLEIHDRVIRKTTFHRTYLQIISQIFWNFSVTLLKSPPLPRILSHFMDWPLFESLMRKTNYSYLNFIRIIIFSQQISTQSSQTWPIFCPLMS